MFRSLTHLITILVRKNHHLMVIYCPLILMRHFILIFFSVYILGSRSSALLSCAWQYKCLQYDVRGAAWAWVSLIFARRAQLSTCLCVCLRLALVFMTGCNQLVVYVTHCIMPLTLLSNKKKCPFRKTLRHVSHYLLKGSVSCKSIGKSRTRIPCVPLVRSRISNHSSNTKLLN